MTDEGVEGQETGYGYVAELLGRLAEVRRVAR